MTATRFVTWTLGGALLALLCLPPTPALAQKHMKEAIDQLEMAKRAAQQARWSSSSRKRQALDAIDKAIEQSRKGMREGRRNNDD